MFMFFFIFYCLNVKMIENMSAFISFFFFFFFFLNKIIIMVKLLLKQFIIMNSFR